MKFNREKVVKLVTDEISKGISMYNLAGKMGITDGRLRAWIAGKASPTFLGAVALMKYFGITDYKELIEE